MPYKLDNDCVGLVTKPSINSGGPVSGGDKLCMISPRLLLLLILLLLNEASSNGDGGGFSFLSTFGMFVVGDDSFSNCSVDGDGEDVTEEKLPFEARVEFCGAS
jgi:hypothetical protein